MYRVLGRFVTMRPILTIALATLAVALCLAGLVNVKVANDWDATLPDSNPISRDIHFIQREFEGRNTIAFLVSGADPAARLAAACDLSAYLERFPGIAAGGVIGMGSNAVKYLEDVGGDLQASGLGKVCTAPGGLTPQVLAGLGPQRGLLVTAKGDFLVYADLDTSSESFLTLADQLDAQLARQARPGVTIAYSGQPVFLGVADRFALRMALFFPIIMLIILALHWEALHSVQAVVIPITTGLLATLCALGIYGWLRQPLDTYGTMAPIVILAVGAGHSVQLLKRYMEELRGRVGEGQADAAQNREALQTTLAAMGPVLTIAVFSAAACLYALMLLDVRAIGRFGLIAGSGLVAALVLELTLVPAIRALMPPPRVRPGYGDLNPRWARALAWVRHGAMTWPARRVLAGLGLLAAVLAIGVANVRQSNSAADLLSHDIPAWRGLDAMTARGVGVYTFDVLVDSGAVNGAFNPGTMNGARALERDLASAPHVRETASAPAMLGFLKCRFNGGSDCAGDGPQTSLASAEEGAQIWMMLFSNGHSSGLVNDSARYVRVRAFLDTDNSVAVGALLDRTHAFAARHGLAVRIGGSAPGPKALADEMIRVSLEKSAMLVVIVALVGFAAFRSLTMLALFAIPSFLTVITNFAVLGWTGIPLNHATACIASIPVGIGVDYLIYLGFRLRERLRQGESFEDAMAFAHASAGGAAVCVASAVAAGYAVLLFSFGYYIHQWIGTLVPITMLASLFGALFVFPFCLRLLRPRLV